MDKLDKILKVVVNRKGLKKATDAARICYLANMWAKGRFEAISFDKGVLKLRADNHCAAQEAQMLEEDLCDHLAEVLESHVVKRVRWQVSKQVESS